MSNYKTTNRCCGFGKCKQVTDSQWAFSQLGVVAAGLTEPDQGREISSLDALLFPAGHAGT